VHGTVIYFLVAFRDPLLTSFYAPLNC